MVRLAQQGLLSGGDSLPAVAHRHRPQFRRDDRVSRLAGEQGRRAAARPHGAGLDRQGPLRRGKGRQPEPQRAADRDAARRAGRTSRRRGASAAAAATRKRRAPRNASFRTATNSASGTRRTSGPSLWNIFNGRLHQRRTFPRLPAEQLDRDGRVAIHRRGEDRDSVALFQPSSARSSIAAAFCWPIRNYNTLLPGEKYEKRTVRFRTVGDATCTGAVESPASNAARKSSPKSPRRAITERGARADDKRSENAMEDRKKAGYFYSFSLYGPTSLHHGRFG